MPLPDGHHAPEMQKGPFRLAKSTFLEAQTHAFRTPKGHFCNGISNILIINNIEMAEKTHDYVVIVAGGKGLRMGSDTPKQFLCVGGKPILMRTIERFAAYSKELGVILVLPEHQTEYWHELCRQYAFSLPYTLVAGGETRFHSVRNGLAAIPDNAEGVVGIHDGVRPFASVEVIRRCYEEARRLGAVIPVTPVVETLRQVSTGKNVQRGDYRLVQTPQTFSIQLLKAAYRQPYDTAFTDDASVVEALGGTVAMTEGNRENIKITTPFDLKVAACLAAEGQDTKQ